MSMLSRLVRRRGRATAVASAIMVVALTVPAASAGDRHHLSKLKGKWTNPVGACVAHIIKVDPTTGDLLSCTGTSDWTGTWNGSTTWTLKGDISLTTGGSGRIREVFTGRARDGRNGKLTFVERFTLDASGHIDIQGRIVRQTRRLLRSRPLGRHLQRRRLRCRNVLRPLA